MTYKLLKTGSLGELPNMCSSTEYECKCSRSVCGEHMCMRNAAGHINRKAKE